MLDGIGWCWLNAVDVDSDKKKLKKRYFAPLFVQQSLGAHSNSDSSMRRLIAVQCSVV